MPFGDRTGPEGRGAKTGRGLGDCNTTTTNNTDNNTENNTENNTDNNTENVGFIRRGFNNFVRGGGRGFGGGRGRGMGRGRR